MSIRVIREMVLWVLALLIFYFLFMHKALKEDVRLSRHDIMLHADSECRFELNRLCLSLELPERQIPPRFLDEFSARPNTRCPRTGKEYSCCMVGAPTQRLIVFYDSVPHTNGDVFVCYAQEGAHGFNPRHTTVYDKTHKLFKELLKSAMHHATESALSTN